MPWMFYLFSLNGRMSRRDYWLRFIIPLVGGMIALVVILPPDTSLFLHVTASQSAPPTVSPTPAFYFLAIAVTWFQISAGTKRFHDRGRSGWFLLVHLVPFVGPLWVFVELALLKGTHGPNQFGHEPS